MQIKSKYKIARRLGSPIFEKTQTAKYSARAARKKDRPRKHPKVITDFGKQLTEKQKLRYTYLVNERQLKNYVTKVIGMIGVKQNEKLFEVLESRLDNAAYRAGFGSTRLQARQLVTHGHLCVNGKRVNVPSLMLKKGDKITIRAGSQTKPIWTKIAEKEVAASPAWIKTDSKKKESVIEGAPKLDSKESNIDFNMVVDYYKR
jgi:small subunit ribosomal protein S4